MTRTLLVVALITLSHTAFAETSIYQWRDANGRIQFGDSPPHPERARPVGQDQLPVVNAQAAPPDIPSMLSRQTGAKARSNKRQRSSRCDGYRRSLAIVEDKLRAGYSEPQGNRLRERRRELSGKLWRECG